MFNLFTKREENTYSIEETIQILFDKINNLEEQNLHIKKEFKNELDKKDIELLNHKNKLIENQNNFNDLKNSFEKLQDEYNILNDKLKKVNNNELELQNNIDNTKNNIINKIKEENGLLKMEINKVNNIVYSINNKFTSDIIIIGYIVENKFKGPDFIEQNIESIISFNKYDKEIFINIDNNIDLLNFIKDNKIKEGYCIANHQNFKGNVNLIHTIKKISFNCTDCIAEKKFVNLKKLHNNSKIPLIFFCEYYTINKLYTNNNFKIEQCLHKIYFNNTIEELTSLITNLKYYTGNDNKYLNYIFINLKKLIIIENKTDITYINNHLNVLLLDFVKIQEKLKILELPISYEKNKKEYNDLIKYCLEKDITLNWV